MQTRKIITKDFIKNELKRKKASMSPIITGFLAAFSIMSAAVGSFLIYQFSGLGIHLFWRILICAVIGVICAVPPVVLVLYLSVNASANRTIERGEFEVVAYKVNYKVEEPIDDYRHRTTYAEKLYFVGYREGVIVTRDMYQMASEGDVFYFVTYRHKGASPLLMYPAKMYEYRE